MPDCILKAQSIKLISIYDKYVFVIISHEDKIQLWFCNIEIKTFTKCDINFPSHITGNLVTQTQLVNGINDRFCYFISM